MLATNFYGLESVMFSKLTIFMHFEAQLQSHPAFMIHPIQSLTCNDWGVTYILFINVSNQANRYWPLLCLQWMFCHKMLHYILFLLFNALNTNLIVLSTFLCYKTSFLRILTDYHQPIKNYSQKSKKIKIQMSPTRT